MSFKSGYPTPIEAPVNAKASEAYEPVASNNPYLSGFTLSFLSKVCASVGPIQSYFWKNAKFGTLKELSVLKEYGPRYDPTVVPAGASEGVDSSVESPGLFGDKIDTTFYTSSDYVEAYKSHRTTPTDVAKRLLALIQEPPHNLAFIEVIEQYTLNAAQESTERYKKGETLGPLDGVPIAVKDEVDILGFKKTFGSVKVFGNGETPTSWCVKQFEEAGAIIIGKTNMHELGSDTTNNNPVKGTPKNPYNQNFYTGGSSGGSAYAVGSGLVPIAVGADGGGSIRVPASYCGVHGIKPSHGRVSGRPSASISASNGVLGPIAGTLEDLALAYRIMATPDPLHPCSSGFPSPGPLLATIQAPRTKIIGIYRPWFEDCDPAVLKLCNAAIERLTSTGSPDTHYKVIDIPYIPYLNESRLAHALSIMTEMSIFAFAQVDSSGLSQLTPPNKILLSVGSQTPAKDYSAANQLRSLLMSHFAFLWKQYPGLILVTPTTPTAGVKIKAGELGSAGVSDTNRSLASMRYVFLANFIGAPSISVGVGYDLDEDEKGEGVPVGLMGLGEWGTEEELFGFGKDVLKGIERRKGEVWVDVLGDVGTA